VGRGRVLGFIFVLGKKTEYDGSMIQAKKIMRAGTPSLSFDQTVADAVEFMNSHSDHFVAVKAADDRYHGVLTEGNLVRIYLRSQSQMDKQALIFYREWFEPMQLIQETEEFPEIVKKIMTSVGHRVFVIDSQGVVVGHITAKDILPYFENKKMELSRPEKAAPIAGSLEQLKSELYLYESFFEKSPLMMHSVNPLGEIQMANEMLHSVLGYQYGDLIGKTIFDLYPKEAHKKAEAGIKTILHQGFHQVIQAQMVTKVGEVIEVEMASRVLLDQNSKPVGTMTVSRPLKMELILKSLKSEITG
jgi:PAS domain S-box-containing protein